jgi:hypothetical protein
VASRRRESVLRLIAAGAIDQGHPTSSTGVQTLNTYINTHLYIHVHYRLASTQHWRSATHRAEYSVHTRAFCTRRSAFELLQFINFLSHQYFFSLGWIETETTNAEAITGLIYQPWMMMDDGCGAVGWMLSRGNRNTRWRPAPVPLCPLQIHHDLARGPIWTSWAAVEHIERYIVCRPLFS